MSPADGNPEQTAAVQDPAGEHSHQVGLRFAASGRNKLWPGVNLARFNGPVSTWPAVNLARCQPGPCQPGPVSTWPAST